MEDLQSLNGSETTGRGKHSKSTERKDSDGVKLHSKSKNAPSKHQASQVERERPSSVLLREALGGLERGWSYTPVAGKTPAQRGWQNAPRPSRKDIEGWLSHGTSLGLRTGSASGIVVIDVDTQKGGEIPRGLSNTVTVETGGGGLHLYFRLPEGKVVGNSVGKLGEHVDVRGERGQAVAVGSIHYETEEMYRWKSGHSPTEVETAILPGWVMTQLNTREASESEVVVRDPKAYAKAALREETKKVLRAEYGERNNSLNIAAFKLGKFVPGGYLREEDIKTALTDAAIESGLTESEIAGTIESGLNAGQERPCRLSVSRNTVESGIEFDDLSNWEEILATPRQWIFDDILLSGIVGCIASAGGVGKSYLCLELALSAALGNPFLEPFKSSRPMNVVISFGEDAKYVVSERIEAIVSEYGLDRDEVRDALRKRIRILSGKPKALMDGDDESEFCGQLREACSTADLVIIDPMSKHSGLRDENFNSEVTRLMNTLQTFTNDGRTTLLYTHHISKAAHGGKSNQRIGARGATAFVDESRWYAFLNKNKEGIILSVEKNNYGRLAEPWLFAQNQEGVLVKGNYKEERPQLIAEGLGKYLAENGSTIGKTEFQRGDTLAAKKVLRALEQESNFRTTKAQREGGVKLGIRLKLIEEFRDSESKSNNGKKLLRPCPNHKGATSQKRSGK